MRTWAEIPSIGDDPDAKKILISSMPELSNEYVLISMRTEDDECIHINDICIRLEDLIEAVNVMCTTKPPKINVL